MSTFYLDYELGNDATTNTPLGWWSVAFTGGTTAAPSVGDTVTGGSSGSTAKMTAVVLSGGSWAGSDAAGTMYFYGKSAAFSAEEVAWTGGHMDIAGDFTYCAWKTITSGATAARIAPGDIIRIAKSPIPTSIGNATWTNLSKTVTLASAQTLTVDNCETKWNENGSGDCTCSAVAVATDAKQGSYCMKFLMDAAVQTGIMQAFYKISDSGIDFSAYQKLSFWIKNEEAIADGESWYICLCSDVAGATVVDTFKVPAIPSTAQWLPLTLTKEGGGNLGAAIKSVAVWTGTTAPTASKYIYLDNIIACTTSGLNLQSLISKTTTEQGGTEGWYGIQSIDGVTILLDNNTATKANSGRGYYTSGTSPETVPTYKRETTKTALAATASTSVQATQEEGNYGLNTEYQGGYNTATNEQTGETFFDGLNGFGNGIYNSLNYQTINRINTIRYNNGLYIISFQNYINNLFSFNCNSGIYVSSNSSTYENIICCNNIYNIILGAIESTNNLFNTVISRNSTNHSVFFYSLFSYNIINNLTVNNNITGINFGADINSPKNNLIKNLISDANVTAITLSNRGTNNDVIKASFTEASPVYINLGVINNRLSINSYNGGGVYCALNYGLIVSQSTTRHTASGVAWQMSPTNVVRNAGYPLELSIAKIAVAASSEVTVKAWCKLSHASDIGAKLICKGGQISGVATDVTDTKTADTDWEELSISFTPTEAGVVEIVAQAYWLANAASQSVYFDDLTVTQA